MAFQPTEHQVNKSKFMPVHYFEESSHEKQLSKESATSLEITTLDDVDGIFEDFSSSSEEEETVVDQLTNFIGTFLIRGRVAESTYVKPSSVQQQTQFSQVQGSASEKSVHSGGVSITDLLNLPTCHSVKNLEHQLKVDALVEQKLLLCYNQMNTARQQHGSDFVATRMAIGRISNPNQQVKQSLDLLLNTFRLMPNDDGKSSERQRKQMNVYHQLLLSYQQDQANWQTFQDSVRLLKNVNQNLIDALYKLPGFISLPQCD